MDISGRKFGKLYVMKKTNEKNKSGDYKYKCQCDCGEIVLVVGSNLKNGHSKSCGCVRRRISKGYRMKNIRLYSIYCNMKQRCYNKNTRQYKNYGGRGIKVCDEWLNNYTSFYNWAINNGYKDNLTIDRINVNGNYEPTNCRWATNEEQKYNKTTSRYITYKEETHCLAEWAKILKMTPQKLRYRVNNWDIKRAFDK